MRHGRRRRRAVRPASVFARDGNGALCSQKMLVHRGHASRAYRSLSTHGRASFEGVVLRASSHGRVLGGLSHHEMCARARLHGYTDRPCSCGTARRWTAHTRRHRRQKRRVGGLVQVSNRCAPCWLRHAGTHDCRHERASTFCQPSSVQRSSPSHPPCMGPGVTCPRIDSARGSAPVFGRTCLPRESMPEAAWACAPPARHQRLCGGPGAHTLAVRPCDRTGVSH
ncbi:hypothetical protein PHLGIDRAFT_414190 [Phlebiopsis gigantea 11061_1 CR5-6]|uniref:Uncharacterized protein n=1 Tax=Phlebiopsis gigantea (strain 11061_1 CR5-6) TaxID=745531 RepID=A0A0C3S8M3_PHLG1|nr:hypothetical protein PHLGIDRAFT_414190 [Phlebiopsis gigantea 11061_1 CR5-6]